MQEHWQDMKKTIMKKFGWTLSQIDECEASNLMRFISYINKKSIGRSETIVVRDGKQYKRVTAENSRL